ncbi:MAG: hypothetical protein V1748_04980 [Actinomycetota bacterium]
MKDVDSVADGSQHGTNRPFWWRRFKPGDEGGLLMTGFQCGLIALLSVSLAILVVITVYVFRGVLQDRIVFFTTALIEVMCLWFTAGATLASIVFSILGIRALSKEKKLNRYRRVALLAITECMISGGALIGLLIVINIGRHGP